jgi:hypothetical protein
LDETVRDRQAALEILRYLAAHPDASDTIEGISQWWVPAPAADLSAAEIQRAVLLLVSRRVLIESRRRGLPPYYRLDADARNDIALWIARLQSR